MILKERDYWLAFSSFPGIGPKRFFLLRKYFGNAKKAWNSKQSIWRKLGLSQKLVTSFLQFREEFDFVQIKTDLEKNLVAFLTLKDKDYPEYLKEIPDPPFVIYIKGKLKTGDKKSLAVVGTRKMTPYGREVTEKFVKWLVFQGFTVVSGLARGVDSTAHRSALEQQGRTIAVLGSGLDTIYPPENKNLAEKICQNGALISEYPLGVLALPANFPLRNRIISGLSLGILVTEGEIKSGTKITARYALDQGREVFAVPGPITSPTSAGPTELIKLGAKLVTCGEDIISELNLAGLDEPVKITSTNKSKNGKEAVFKVNFNNQTEKQLWELLMTGSKHIDELVRNTGFSTAKVMSTLTLMEVSGIVKNIGNGTYMAV